MRSVFNGKKREKILEAVYNSDKEALGLPFKQWSMSGITSADFELYAPSYALRKELIRLDVAFIIHRLFVSAYSDPAIPSRLTPDGFRNWLEHSKEGQIVYAEADKLVEQRLPRDVSYTQLKQESYNFWQSDLAALIFYIMLLAGVTGYIYFS